MAQDQIIYKNILENMTDGVMTISLDGRIITFNEAAEDILNLRREEVINRPFGEIFLTMEGNDAFNQAVLNAVYDSTTTHNATVAYRSGEKNLILSVTTSFLQSGEEGSKRKAAVIVVFCDRTEVERLRQTETQLSEELKGKHKELQDSFVELAEVNANLQTALKKVQVIRISATVLVILLFLSIGVFTWFKAAPGGPAASPAGKKDGAPGTFLVRRQSLTDSISLRGILKPLKVVNVTSPFSGAVKEKLFEYGQPVEKGQLLLRLDATETETKYREAKTAFIEAAENWQKVTHWQKSDEMAKATRDLDAAKRKLKETEILFKAGIVSAVEYEGDKKGYEDQQLSFNAEKAKGEGERLTIARLKYENAKVRLDELALQLRQADVYAPVSGTILLPQLADKDKEKKGKILEKGASLSQGEILLSIGDTSGLAVTAEVDEMEITKIKKGQEVTISGDAFPEVEMKGRVYHLSSQAGGKAGDSEDRKTASFEITITVDQLSAEQAGKILLGMSANLTILTLNKPGAILVPIPAVKMEGAEAVVLVRDRKTKETKKVKVQTGLTTVDSLEIVEGLKDGDEIVLN
jgi:PAS domain S-box-containing protein